MCANTGNHRCLPYRYIDPFPGMAPPLFRFRVLLWASSADRTSDGTIPGSLLNRQTSTDVVHLIDGVGISIALTMHDYGFISRAKHSN